MSEPFPISETGVWLCEDTKHHSFDEGLARAIVDIFLDEHCRVLDLGCGNGRYVSFLNDAGIPAVGLDGNPNTSKFAQGCAVFDLTKPLPVLGDADWVLSLEVGEHIPARFESVFLDNLTQQTRRGVLLSWFPREGHGIGHVNPRPNEWVKGEMAKRSFYPDDVAADHLRSAATSWWFKESLMVFRKGG